MWSAKEPKLQALHHRWDWCCERGQRAPGNCWSMQSPQTLRRHNAVNLVIETLTASHKVWKTHCWRHLEQGLAEPFPGLPGWSFRIDRSTKPPALLPCKPLLVSICQARYIWPFVAGCLPPLYVGTRVTRERKISMVTWTLPHSNPYLRKCLPCKPWSFSNSKKMAFLYYCSGRKWINARIGIRGGQASFGIANKTCPPFIACYKCSEKGDTARLLVWAAGQGATGVAVQSCDVTKIGNRKKMNDEQIGGKFELVDNVPSGLVESRQADKKHNQ